MSIVRAVSREGACQHCTAGALSFLVCALSGCREPSAGQEQSAARRVASKPAATWRATSAEIEQLFHPLRLGMSEQEVRSHFPGFTSMLWTTHPAQNSPGGAVTLPNGIEVGFAFSQDGALSYLLTTDERIAVATGISIGVPAALAVQVCDEPHPCDLRGYGRFLRFRDGVYLRVCEVLEYNEDSTITAIEPRTDLLCS